MSRIGNRKLNIPEGINIIITEDLISISKDNQKIDVGYNRFFVNPLVEEKTFITKKVNNSKESKSQYGTINSLVSSAIEGFIKGFQKTLEIVGVGYKATLEGEKLRLDLGFSHPIYLEIPQSIKVKLVSSLEISLTSFDKQALGEYAAKIRNLKKPEPYKGKGIKYKDEIIIRKVGKTSEGSKK